MGENKGKGGGQSNAAPVAANRPTITVPARPSLEGFFKGQVSPGPMTLVSSFFAENHPEECRSFSQLLAGVMASPNAAVFGRPPEVATIEGGLSYKQCRTFGHSLLSPPSPFVINSMGLSPTAFLDSPVFASQGPFEISHQQALAHVTAQAVHSQAQKQLQAEYASAQPQVALPLAAHPVMPTINTAPIQLVPANNIAQNLNQRIQIAPAVADKPESDGYNWRKYGQKHVKGTDHPRSYYKCTHPTCPVKKKVECTLDGLVMEIIYKGQHNHEQPQPSKRAKDGSCEMNGNLNIERKPKMETQVHGGNTRRGDENVLGHLMIKKDETMAHELSSVSSEDDELGDDAGIRVHDENDDQHDSKRRNIDSNKTRTALHKTIAEPRVVVQTRSEVDLLDDGYRWRKYGQKVVKGNPHPRSYYKCTFVGCNVRKHVERASTDPTEVVTTYEGKHHHDLPASRSSSHHTAIPGPKPVNDQVLQKPATLKMLHSREGGLQNATKSTSLLPKEEQNTVSCSQLMSSR